MLPAPSVTSVKNPDGMSGRFAQEALRKVHAEDAVSPSDPLEAHADPKVPGANYVDGSSDGRYWVGLQGEVHRTSTRSVPTTRSGEFQDAHTRYTAAVESVRLHYRTPMSDQLFAVPDTHVADAFFVYDAKAAQTVRWVSPEGDVLAGYQDLDGAPRWDERTVEVRTLALAREPGTASLVQR